MGSAHFANFFSRVVSMLPANPQFDFKCVAGAGRDREAAGPLACVLELASR
jgi:hypothetical protein